MVESQQTDSLPNDVVGVIVEEILSWDGKFPLRWSDRLTDLLRDPAVFQTYIATHTLIWGASAELARTMPPEPAPKGENSRT